MTTFQDAFNEADAEIESEAVALDEGPAETGGETEGEGTVDESVTAPTYFNLEEYGEQVVRIKVDGEERDVLVKDLPNGFMRNEAFTQKTQALAADRQRLQAAETLAAAYDRNPLETVRFLAQQQGLTLAEAKAQVEAAVEQEDSWANDTADPRMSAIEAQMAEIQNERARGDLERTLATLGTRYGEDFDANEVVAQALKIGTTDLEGVFKTLAFDRIMARQQATSQVQEQRAVKEAQTTSAKASLGATVSSGESFAGAGAAGSAPIRTVAQAMEAAIAESGFNF